MSEQVGFEQDCKKNKTLYLLTLKTRNNYYNAYLLHLIWLNPVG